MRSSDAPESRHECCRHRTYLPRRNAATDNAWGFGDAAWHGLARPLRVGVRDLGQALRATGVITAGTHRTRHGPLWAPRLLWGASHPRYAKEMTKVSPALRIASRYWSPLAWARRDCSRTMTGLGQALDRSPQSPQKLQPRSPQTLQPQHSSQPRWSPRSSTAWRRHL